MSPKHQKQSPPGLAAGFARDVATFDINHDVDRDTFLSIAQAPSDFIFRGVA